MMVFNMEYRHAVELHKEALKYCRQQQPLQREKQQEELEGEKQKEERQRVVTPFV
jgi:hypothetical protein